MYRISLFSYSVSSALLVLCVERQPSRKFRLMFDEDADKRMKEVERWDALNPGSRNCLNAPLAGETTQQGRFHQPVNSHSNNEKPANT